MEIWRNHWWIAMDRWRFYILGCRCFRYRHWVVFHFFQMNRPKSKQPTRFCNSILPPFWWRRLFILFKTQTNLTMLVFLCALLRIQNALNILGHRVTAYKDKLEDKLEDMDISLDNIWFLGVRMVANTSNLNISKNIWKIILLFSYYKIWDIGGHLQLVSCLYGYWSPNESALKKRCQERYF